MWDSNSGWTVVSVQDAVNNYFDAYKEVGYPNLTYSDFQDSKEYESALMGAQIDNQVSTLFAETFARMANFIKETNEKISNPTTTPNALIAGLRENFGLRSSVQEMTEENAGKMHVAIDYTPDDDLNYQIASYMESTCVVGSTYMVGDIEQPIVLSEGGIETYRWVAQTEQDIAFKITMKVSRNSTAATDTPEDVLSKFMANWDEFYWIGMDVEPEKYFEINRDAPYASEIITEYSSDDGTTWETAPYESPYNIKFIPTLDVANIIFK